MIRLAVSVFVICAFAGAMVTLIGLAAVFGWVLGAVLP